MLVYANHLRFNGADAEEAIFKAAGAWLKEQLGVGPHPQQLRQDGSINGTRDNAYSSLRVNATDQDEPKFYSWVLTNGDSSVYGRQWITELGLKVYGDSVDLSCVLKTDERSTLVEDPVTPSQPRVINYIANNILQADNADFSIGVDGRAVKHVGQDADSYRGLLVEIERQDRISPLVLVSPTVDGDYLLNAERLQKIVIGLAQVVQIERGFDSYEMEEIVGKSWSAWGGSVNVINSPIKLSRVRNRFFLKDEIEEWGSTQQNRISQLLATVTHNTNIMRLQNRIRPEGVMLLALQRRMQTVRSNSDQMDIDELKAALEDATLNTEAQDKYFGELADEISLLESNNSELTSELADATDEISSKEFEIQTVRDQLDKAGGGRTVKVDIETMMNLICQKSAPSPIKCIELIEKLYGDKCIVLKSAKKSAEDMNRFANGRVLMDMIKKLVVEFREAMINGGDNQARYLFGTGEYAAKESETVRKSAELTKLRTFDYRNEPTKMFRHLKIGVDDDITKTIRVHFHWDAKRQKIVIGYCGKHLPIST